MGSDFDGTFAQSVAMPASEVFQRPATCPIPNLAPKIAPLRSIGAHQVLNRDTDVVSALGEDCLDVVVDNVAGPRFGSPFKVLKRGGRYVSAGAVGGPLVTFDWRTVYLKDLTVLGCTARDDHVFPNLLSYIEGFGLRPLVARVFPLEEIVQAQKEFLQRSHIGKFVLVPPPQAA
jgi:NADPH:quinone reductase-like Zn-dependent oxidoreductase